MKVYNMIKFIGSKNPKYKWENIVDYLPYKPIEGKGFLDNNGNRQGLWEESRPIVSGLGFSTVEQISKGLFKDDKKEGVWLTYRHDEYLIYKGSYKNDLRDGIWEHYYWDGNLKYKGSYKNDLRDGIWEYYTINGNLLKKELY
jgi:antitoxin component YwqK of YwqJK toxin-antitoxin module